MTFKKLLFYLRGKHVIVETDHNNLLFLESTEVPKLRRWLAFLQSFSIAWRHIKGKDAVLPDMLSRLFAGIPEQSDAKKFAAPERTILSSIDGPANQLDDPALQTAQHESSPLENENENRREMAGLPRSRVELLQLAHGNPFHTGINRTWAWLNKYYPGHRISVAQVTEHIQTCSTCQLARHHMTAKNTIQPRVRVANAPNERALLGSDYLSLKRTTKGNCGVYVIINVFSKLCFFFPAKTHSAWELASAMFTYCSRYGTCVSFISDPGSDYTSHATALLNKWLGMEPQFSLVDVHESNMTESSNRKILEMLRYLNIDDLDMFKANPSGQRLEWDDPIVQAAVTLAMNENVSTETGHTPFELTFGPNIADRFRFLAPGPEYNASKYLKLLGQLLAELRLSAYKFSSKVKSKRQEATPLLQQNILQKGDFVVEEIPKSSRDDKLRAPFDGPYMVIAQKEGTNDVQLRNLITDGIETRPVDRLKIFIGDAATALAAAKKALAQHEIAKITGWQGDVNKRTTTSFHTQFADGSEIWLPYSADISATTAFEDFCNQRHVLWPLLLTTEILKAKLKTLKSQAIIFYDTLPTTVYVDIRFFGNNSWYEQLGLPDPSHITYVLECKISLYANPVTKKEVRIHFPLIEEGHIENNIWVQTWGRYTQVEPFMLLIDAQFARDHPKFLPDAHRSRLVRKFNNLLNNI